MNEITGTAAPDRPPLGALYPMAQGLVFAGIKGTITEVTGLALEMARVIGAILGLPFHPMIPSIATIDEK